MSNNDYSLFDGNTSSFQKAMDAMNHGDDIKAYRMFGDLWKSELWQEDVDVQLNYARVCEKVEDHTTALKIYSKLMETMAKNPNDNNSLIVEANMTRLSDLINDTSNMMNSRIDVKQNLDEASLIKSLFSFAYERIIQPGESICDMGDVAGQMWLLTEGEVEVITAHGEPMVIKGSADFPCLMGELAYFTGMRRSATLKCTSRVTLMELPFERIIDAQGSDPSIQLMLDHLFRSRLVFHLLSQHNIFKKLDEDVRRQVALSFRRTSYLPKKMLVEEGVPRDNAFLVQSGTLLLLKKNDDGVFEFISSMHSGDICHLGGLLKDYHAPYRIVTGTPCRLLRLKSETFSPIMAKNPWLVKAILEHTHESVERQVLHPERKNLWAADRYIKMDKKR